MSEVFGEENHIITFIWHRRQNADSRNITNASTDHEYIIVYGRSEQSIFRGKEIDKSKYQNPDNDPRGPWASIDLSGLADKNARPNLHYDIVDPKTGIAYPPNPSRGWSKSKETMLKLIENNEILFPKNPTGRPRQKKFIKDLNKTNTGFSSILEDVGYTTGGTREILDLLEGKAFPFPKPTRLITKLMNQILSPGEIVLDFFSGSATTAHSVIHLNAEDGGNRKFIMVQLPEKIDEKSDAYIQGYKTICEIGKERIRRAAKKIKEETGADIDYGFRVYRVDSSNMKDIFYTPENLGQMNLDDMVSNIKEDRSGEDLLTQVMLECGLELSLPMETKEVEGKTVHYVAGNSLIACFDDDVYESVIRIIAEDQPLRVVFRDSSFRDDSARINVEEMFKLLSPSTEIQVL